MAQPISDMPISRDWTDKERLRAIATYASNLRQTYVKAGRVDPVLTYRIVEVIQFLATMPAEFLEMNKQNLIRARKIRTLMIVGFTGTQRGMTQLQEDRLPGLLHRLRLTGARHGDCVGADSQFHSIVRNTYPFAEIHGHPGPDGPKRAHCDFNTCAEPKEYLKRNMDIVQFSDCLVATPHGPEVLRSGTWSTVRYAKSIGRIVIVVWPDGDMNCYFET